MMATKKDVLEVLEADGRVLRDRIAAEYQPSLKAANDALGKARDAVQERDCQLHAVEIKRAEHETKLLAEYVAGRCSMPVAKVYRRFSRGSIEAMASVIAQLERAGVKDATLERLEKAVTTCRKRVEHVQAAEHTAHNKAWAKERKIARSITLYGVTDELVLLVETLLKK